MSEATAYFNGVPTGPDVEKLMAKWPSLEPGEVVEYAEVEKVLKLRRTDPRYRTVTEAWRRRYLREQNFVLDRVLNQGFKRLEEKERSRENVKGWLQKQRLAARRANDQRRVVVTQLDDPGRHAHDHATQIMIGMAVEARKASLQLTEPPAPQKQLPRGGPVMAGLQ